MPRMSEATLCAFRDELGKEAGFADVVARHAPMLKNVGSAAGIGALAGAGLGGVSGAAGGYREARNAGAGVGESALHGLGRGLGGALSGGAAGALVGGGAGALGSRVGLNASNLASRNDILGSAARSGQRQTHALTGMLTPGELEGVRGGAYGAKQHLAELKSLGKPTARAEKGVEWAQKAQDANLTSLPGYAGALKKDVGGTLATSVKEQYYNTPTAMGALMLGLPALNAAKTLSTPEAPWGEGKGERLGREAGNIVGGVASGLMPAVGGAVMGSAAGAAGGGVGRVIDRIRGRRPMVNDLGNKAPLEPTEAQNTPSERITSPSAAGGQKDIGI